MFTLGLACATLFSLPAIAADLSQAITEAAQYESGANAAPLRQLEQAVREAAGNPAQRAEVEGALVQLLAPTSSFEARRFACTQLAIIGTDASLPGLADLLKNPQTTGIACLALGSNPSLKVNELLVATLNGLRNAPRDQTVQIIVTLGDRRASNAVKTLETFSRNAEPAIAQAAMVALGKIADSESLKILAVLRQAADLGTARAAVLASLNAADLAASRQAPADAAAIYTELLAAQQPAYVRRAAFEGALRADKDGGEQRALATLRGQDAALKAPAIVHVRRMTSPDASAKFAAEMPRLNSAEQVLMVESLAARNDAAARAVITDKVVADDAAVRQAAVVALANVGDASAVPALAKALTGTANADAQPTIEMALASLKGGTAVDQQILDQLKTGAVAAKAGLINALARRGAKAALPALLTEAGSADGATAKAAFRAVGQLASGDDLGAVLNQLAGLKAAPARSEAESAAIKVIERTQDVDKRAAVVSAALAKASTVETRCSLLSLLPACGGATALAAVTAARADKEPSVREAALRALAEWPDTAAIDPLLEAAQATTQNTERVLALRGSVRLLGLANNFSTTEVAARFMKAMALAKNAGEKKLVLGGLANVHDPVALTLVEPFLSDPAVQAEAALAVVSLAPRLCGAYRDATRAALQKVGTLPVEPALKQKAADLLAIVDRFEDFILGWQVAGPYTQEGKMGQALFDVGFPPEQGGTPIIKWQIMPAGATKARPWQLDLAKLYGGDNRVAYARAWVYSETQQAARLELGSDDGIKAWFNGQVVVSANRGGDVVPGAEKANVTLRKGWNVVMLKVIQWSAGWGFCARVAKPDGAALGGLRIAVTPPN